MHWLDYTDATYAVIQMQRMLLQEASFIEWCVFCSIGTKRQDSDQSGEREVQRTMLELLNQLDGFSSNDRVKVIAATNRPDILDPALLRSGRLDRKIELPLPDEKARAYIMKIHSRKMNVDMGGEW